MRSTHQTLQALDHTNALGSRDETPRATLAGLRRGEPGSGGTLKMARVGVIRATPGFPDLNPRHWLALIERHPSLEGQRPRRGLNPFATEPITIPPRPDAARARLRGQDVGFLRWTERHEIDVHALEGESEPVIQLARELAATLGATFVSLAELQER